MRRRLSKRVVCFMLAAALICPCAAEVPYAFAEETTGEKSAREAVFETGQGEDTAHAEGLALLPEENRLIVRTEADISGAAQADGQIEVAGGYILSYDSAGACADAEERLAGMAGVESAEADTFFEICQELEETAGREFLEEEQETASAQSDTEQETADTETVESTERIETESAAAETLIETEMTADPEEETEGDERLSETDEPETDQKGRTEQSKIQESELIKSDKDQKDTEEDKGRIDPSDWRKQADLQGRKLVILIDTGAGEADAHARLTGDSPSDENGHGSQMASLIRLASGGAAYIVSIKAIGDDGRGRLSDIYTAVSLAVQAQADVVNLSISARDSGEMEGLKSLLGEAVRMGIQVVCAAGNHCLEAEKYCPGSCGEVMTIGACDGDGAILPHSNYGKAIDCFAVSGSTSESAALVSGYICRYGAQGLSGLSDIFMPDQVRDPVAGEPVDIADDDLFHISADALKAGSTVKLNGAYNVGPAVYASDSTYLAEYTFRIGGSYGYCGNIAAARGSYASASGTRSYVAGVYDFTDVGGKDVNYIVKQVYDENKNYSYNGRTIDGTLLRKILYYSDGAPGDSRFSWSSFERGYAENSYVFSDLPGSNRESDPNRAKYTKSNAYRKGVVSCACSYIWGQEMGLCTVNANTSSKTYLIGKRYVDAIKGLPAPPSAFTAYFAVLSDEYGLDTSMSVVQPVLFWTARDTEQIRIRKTVSFSDKDMILPDPFHPADQYSPKGLVFGVYTDKACKNLAARLTIGSADAQGNYYSGWVTLKHGPYYIKEIDNASNKNIKINSQVTGFTVEMNDTLYPLGKRTMDITDLPQTGSLQIKKLVVDSSGEDVGDVYSAEGVRFGLYTAQTGGKKLAELTIGKRDRDGAYVSDVLEHIAYGTYYLQELSIPQSLSDVGAIVLKDRVKCQIVPGKLNKQGVFIAEIKNTVAKPSIGTSACDKQTGSRDALADNLIEIVDHVSYKNLIPGREYTISGTIMDRETKKALSAGGKEVRQTLTFKPDKSTGEALLTFTFDGRSLCSRKLVVFEELYYGDKLMAAHKDYEDKNQQIDMTAPGSITLIKYGEDGKSPLSGVSFLLTDREGHAVKDLAGNTISEKTSGKDGKVVFSDLPYGDYLIKETRTAKGYSLLPESVKVTVPYSCSEAQAREDSIDLKGAFYSEKEDTYYLTDLTYEVSDSPALTMPRAGMPAYAGGAAGVMMIMAAGLVLLLQRRNKRYIDEA